MTSRHLDPPHTHISPTHSTEPPPDGPPPLAPAPLPLSAWPPPPLAAAAFRPTMVKDTLTRTGWRWRRAKYIWVDVGATRVVITCDHCSKRDVSEKLKQKQKQKQSKSKAKGQSKGQSKARQGKSKARAKAEQGKARQGKAKAKAKQGNSKTLPPLLNIIITMITTTTHPHTHGAEPYLLGEVEVLRGTRHRHLGRKGDHPRDPPVLEPQIHRLDQNAKVVKILQAAPRFRSNASKGGLIPGTKSHTHTHTHKDPQRSPTIVVTQAP